MMEKVGQKFGRMRDRRHCTAWVANGEGRKRMSRSDDEDGVEAEVREQRRAETSERVRLEERRAERTPDWDVRSMEGEGFWADAGEEVVEIRVELEIERSGSFGDES